MYEKLLTRRSVRKYTAQQVSDAELDKVLLAGLYALMKYMTRDKK